MKNEAVCTVVSIPVEKLPYKYNEAEELVIMMKAKLSSMFQQAAAGAMNRTRAGLRIGATDTTKLSRTPIVHRLCPLNIPTSVRPLRIATIWPTGT